LRPTNLALPLVSLLLVSLLSSIFNSIYGNLDLEKCFFRHIKLIECLAIFVVILNSIRDRQSAKAMIYMMVITGGLVGVYGILQGIEGAGKVTGPPGETSNILVPITCLGSASPCASS